MQRLLLPKRLRRLPGRRLALKGKRCSCSRPRRQPQKEPSKGDAEAKRVEQELAAKVTQEDRS